MITAHQSDLINFYFNAKSGKLSKNEKSFNYDTKLKRNSPNCLIKNERFSTSRELQNFK
jgi:hypothetical protein